MTVLVYGFKPFKDYKTNVTEEAIKRLRGMKDVKFVVFPATFNRKQYIDAVKRHRPDVVFGLGQYPQGKKYRFERKAVNRYALSKKNKPHAIRTGGPKQLFLPLRLPTDRHSWESYDAGTYVCNYSMYVIAEYLRDSDTAFAFVHVPRTKNPGEVATYVRNLIKKIADSHRYGESSTIAL